MDASLQELNQKIDLLTTQVTYLSAQAQLAERQRQERLELVRDITPLANQAFELAVEQLDEVQSNIDLGDILRLFKRLLRNGRNFEKMLDQLESFVDLLNTVGPLTDDAFSKAVELLADLEAKGYFSLAPGGRKLADNLVASISAEDLERMGDSVAPVMALVKQVTRPETINFVNDSLVKATQELAKPVDISYAGLFKQLRDPSTRRGLALTLRILQVIGSQAEVNHQAKN